MRSVLSANKSGRNERLMKSQTAKIFTPVLILTLVAIIVAAVIIGTSKNAAAFDDVQDNAWYADAVTYCSEEGIIQGTSEGTFSPDQTMTRAMLATVLYRMSSSPQVNTTPAFTDTKAGVWYSNAIAWAAENNIIQGLGNNIFGVDNPVQREQIATILWRYSGSPASDEAVIYTDSAAISSWAATAISWARSNKIINGRENNNFAPQENTTRAEVAMILYNYLEQRKTVDNNQNNNPTDNKPNSSSSGSSSSGNAGNNLSEFDFTNQRVKLNSGYYMPIVGLGTYALSDSECVNSVTALLNNGGRLIDTAYMYHNEQAVGKAIRQSSVPREEIFVTTKLYPNQFANAAQAIDEALEKLDVEYIDLMLLHHPGANDVAAYKAMEQAVRDGKIRSIGLSNWYVEELETFLPQVSITPAVVQNEIHPYYQENNVIPYIQNLGIVVEGWYPFGGRGHTKEMLSDPVISAIAQAHNVTSAQVILRWNLQKGVAVIPGSSNPDHIKENLNIFGFQLTESEMAQINALDRNEKHDWY